MSDSFFREVSKLVEEREFGNSRGSEAVGFSKDEYGLVVQALDSTTGDLAFGFEPVQDQLAMAA